MQKIQFQRSAGMIVFSESDFEKISTKLINNNIELEEVEFATKEDLLALEVGLNELENGETTSLEELLKMRPISDV